MNVRSKIMKGKNMNYMQLKKGIIEAHVHLRTTNHTIPDEVLDFMKDASLEKAEKEFAMKEKGK